MVVATSAEHPIRPGNLGRHFVLWVLMPPFCVLLVVAVIGLWQLNNVLHRQAIDGLRRSATTTAAALEQQFSLRDTVLKQTGTELLIIKNEYRVNRTALDDNHNACRAYLLKNANPRQAPNGVCQPFLGGLDSTAGRLAALENEYARLGEALIGDQNQRINERLSAFKAFFPETLALVVLDDTKQPVSSALSGAFKGSIAPFQADAETALRHAIKSKLTTVSGFRLAVSAFPFGGGSALAAYDLQHENFIRQTWSNAPIDRTRSLALLLDSSGKPAYPLLKDSNQLTSRVHDLRHKAYVDIKLDGVDHTVVAARVTGSDWLAVVASPTAAVLATSRDAQLAGLVIIGLLMVGFLWVGTFFIQRTLRNIVKLAQAALIFGSGKLEHTIRLKHADGEFLQLADTMNLMAKRIAAAEQALDTKNKEFIAVASHELRSPLTAIVTNLSVFQDVHTKQLGAEAKQLIDEAFDGTVRLRDLVNDMLNVARLESGTPDFVTSAVPINTVIKDIVSKMSHVAADSKVKLEYNPAHAAKVVTDEQYLRVITTNFVSNAVKYNRPGGNVAISHIVQDDKLVTMIEDTGLGIPEAEKARIFEKFFRVRHADRKHVTGTGLGMYITKRYIEQMGGQVWFESQHGKGTKFYFSLPIA